MRWTGYRYESKANSRLSQIPAAGSILDNGSQGMDMGKSVGKGGIACSTGSFGKYSMARFLTAWFWTIYVGFVSVVILTILNL